MMGQDCHAGLCLIYLHLDKSLEPMLMIRRTFGSVLDIVPLADFITKLTAQCKLYGKRAFFTLRKTKETQTELIGGPDVYMPVCRQHYVDGQVAIEATRAVLQSQKVLDDEYVEGVSLAN